MAHPIENIMKTTMEQLKEMVDVNTIVGTPILTTGETMILPVSKVSMGFFSGGGEYGQEEKKESKSRIARSGEELSGEQDGCYPFAGASVAGMTLT
ncbi:MAG: sporulation protein YtfJ, partial [Clostridia bacterium]|nr:sporulation protein YtfJ [Clostridia bacterium]